MKKRRGDRSILVSATWIFVSLVLIYFAVVTFSRLSGNVVSTDSSLIAYYNFDDGTANDASGNQHNGVFRQGVNVLPPNSPDVIVNTGVGDKGVYLDGINNFVRVDNLPISDKDSFSVSLWALPYFDSTSSPDRGLIFWLEGTGTLSNPTYFGISHSSQPDVISFLLNSNDGSKWAYSNIPFTSQAQANQEWIHLVGVFDYNTGNVSLYSNGIKVAEKHQDSQGIQNSGILWIGKAGTGYFKGVIDEVKIYNKALSPEEIMSLAGIYNTCPINEVFTCPIGYVVSNSSNTGSATSFYSDRGCSGREYSSLGSLPFRQDLKQVCTSSSRGNKVYFSFRTPGLHGESVCNSGTGSGQGDTLSRGALVVEGSCISVSPSCVDSDGDGDVGINPVVQGITKGSEDIVYTDYCLETPNTLVEYYCRGGSAGDVDSTNINCPYGCSNGACLPAPNTITLTCNDVDFNCNGKNDGGDIDALTTLFSSMVSNSSLVINNALISQYSQQCSVFGNYLQKLSNIGKTHISFNDITSTNNKSYSCFSPLTCSDVDFNCDNKVDIQDATVINGIFASGAGTGNLITPELVTQYTNQCSVLGDFFKRILYRGSYGGHPNFGFGDITTTINTVQNCTSVTGQADYVCGAINTGGNPIKPGVRLNVGSSLKYCDPITLDYVNVKSNNEFCLNDYECNSNTCIDGKCVSLRLEVQQQTNELNRQGGILKQIFCAIFHPADFIVRNDSGEDTTNNNYLACVG